MKKIFILSLTLITSFLKLYAQNTINPLQTTEQCPGVDITFTVTIAGQSVTSVVGRALNVVPTVVSQPFNISVSGGYVTFNFVGRFADDNNKQTFTVNYKNTNNQALTQDFTFIKIKSLSTATPYSQIYPSPTSLTANRCQSQNFSISFPNVQFGNIYEAPPIGYGSIATYEYLLPIGWLLNGAPSTGSWMPGNNAVTVTSDLSHGDLGTIQVRAVNPCGANLQKGQISTISISRPAPVLSISSTQNALCSGCATYTINGLTSGASVQWSLSSTANASISGCSTCSTVSVCRNTSISAVVTLTATVTDCIQTYPAVSINIPLGAPTAVTGISEQKTNNDCVTETSVYTAIGGTGATNYNWYYRRLPTGSFSLRQSGTSNTYTLSQSNKGTSCIDYEIKVEASNSCITTPFVKTLQSEVCPCILLTGATTNYTLYPNPATNALTVSASVDQTKSTGYNTFDEIKIYDFQGNLKKVQRFGKVKTTTINVSGLAKGTYIIEISNGTNQERQELLIKK